MECEDVHQRRNVLAWKYDLMRHVIEYALPFVIIDAVAVIGWITHWVGTFETIKFIYLSNCVGLPVLFLAHVCWKIMKKQTGAIERWVKAGCSFALLGIFGYATLREPYRLQIEIIDLLSENVPQEIRILHCSDIQTIGVGAYERDVFRQMHELQPDLILHTGDLVQVYDPRKKEQALRDVAALFRQVRPKYGIYHVRGDTAPRTPDDIRLFDELSGATMLIDQAHVIHDGALRLRLFGLSVGNSRSGARDLVMQWQRACRPDELTILLGHAPDYVLDITDLPIDLCLAGHTHGGQIRLPVWGPILTLTRVPRAWAMGYHEVNQLRLNVSAGVGSEHLDNVPPIRINCPPAMTLFVVKPSASIHPKL